MTDLSLRECEGEAETARAKLARDLEVLRSSRTMSAFTGDLKREAMDTKTAAVGKLRSTVEGFADEWKAKAAANPMATLLIGVGIAWRLYRKPPIASLLVGAGLVSLWRTQAQPGAVRDNAELLRHGGERLGEQVSALADTAGQKAAEAREVISQKASEMMAESADRLDEWRVRAGDALQQVRARAEDTASQAVKDGAERLRQARNQAVELAQQARGAAAEAKDAIAQKASQMAESMAGRLDEGRASAEDAVQRGLTAAKRAVTQPEARERVRVAHGEALEFGGYGRSTPETSRDALGGHDAAGTKEIVLRGIAGAALVAALALMYQKRGSVEGR
jgi:hypothetical protein